MPNSQTTSTMKSKVHHKRHLNQHHTHTSMLLIHVHILSHEKYLRLIQLTIELTINMNPTHSLMLVGDFNWDIQLRGRHIQQTITPPSQKDKDWHAFTTKSHLTPIPNHMHTNLIDDFYISINDYNHQQFQTNTHINLNSNHFPPPRHLVRTTPIT